MNLSDLISRICAITTWTLTELCERSGASSRTLQNKRHRPNATKEPCAVKILRTACKNGATADALAYLYAPNPVPNKLLAVALYPNIAAYEFEAVSRMSHDSGHRPFSAQETHEIVQEQRRRGPPIPPESAEDAEARYWAEAYPQQ